MLKHLLIENYALIEKLDIDFEKGLTVITGETGAGKSIVLGALSMILGQRADTRVLMNHERKCIIEGTFDVGKIPIKSLFEAHQLDYDHICIFRREINPQGKSRAFINDTPVTLNIISEFAARLIDIHSQHQNLMVGEACFQFDAIDSFCSNLQRVSDYREKYHQFNELKKEIEQLHEQEKKSRSDLDYYKFQLNELDQAKINPDEYDDLEGELQVMQHAEEIRGNLDKASYLFDQAENNLISGLNQIIQLIRPLARYNEKYNALDDRLTSLLIETKDISDEVFRISSEVVYDPEKVNRLQHRYDHINGLFLKHNVQTITELGFLREDFRHKISAIDSLEEQIQEKTIRLKSLESQLQVAAEAISKKRHNSIPSFEKQITLLLQQLGMPGGKFLVKCNKVNSLTLNGSDSISFHFNANIGGELKEISKVASGGELSRVMLAIKSVISQKNLLPTIIFDEIDTGISGETGTRVANILQTISYNMQVIAITHLPQIASRGTTHLLVYKTVDNGRTRTLIKKTREKERVSEIAKMLGGELPTESMIKTAKELLLNNQSSF